GYRTYPHVDMYETGASAGERLLRILAGEPRPRTVMRKLPMIVPGENMQTASGPMAEIWRYGEQLQRPEILSFSVFGVQAWLDIDEMGCAVAAVTIGDEGEARTFCDAVARRFWDLRREFDVALLTPAEAIREGLATEGQPVVLSESSDSPTAGSPGDSADMLRALLEHAPGVPSAVWLRDETAAKCAWQAGIGARLSLELGGTHDRVNRRPVAVEAGVCALSDGRFVMTGSQYTGMQTTMGRAAVLRVGAVTVLVGSLPAPNIDPELYRSQGIEPSQKKIVVVKSANAFRAEYGPFAAKMLLVDTPGISSANLRSVPYKRVPRPIYPLDEMDQPWL
ncbi:MAG: MlrC C-terminal domain-containing protein, partial [Bryobacteraceae bacterium]